MIRKIGKRTWLFYHWTCTASIHKCISSKYHLNRLVLSFAPGLAFLFLLIGENSLYSPKIRGNLLRYKRVENYWRLFEADTLSDVITK